ncbi:MAG: dihydroorotate dehydrogenase electron transfer subunit [Planctomycetales bacterium]|nr:dihydroorotate dehydrogenase electron transfer subunit [Planctomycetales bacterium]
MIESLRASHYADAAVQQLATVIENVALARDTFRVRLHCPEIARRIVPGQFVMLRLAGLNDPLLGRPLALYDTVLGENNEPIGIDVVYLVIGKMTGKLASFREGMKLDVWGPLGNGFEPRETPHLIMVAGGIGQTPFVALGAEALGHKSFGSPSRRGGYASRVTLCYGARQADYLAGVDDFRAAGIEVRVSTDDGSAGHCGLVTDLLRETLDSAAGNARVVCCGPEPMMEAVAELTRQRRIECEVSLESPMACGIGICFSCVARVRQPDGGWDYKRTCVEGPVFKADSIVW